jgi:hypothetical protein
VDYVFQGNKFCYAGITLRLFINSNIFMAFIVLKQNVKKIMTNLLVILYLHYTKHYYLVSDFKYLQKKNIIMFSEQLTNGGDVVTDSALKELEARNKVGPTQTSKSTLIIHSVQRVSTVASVCSRGCGVWCDLNFNKRHFTVKRLSVFKYCIVDKGFLLLFCILSLHFI